MNKIIAIGASNSRNSINKEFASWAAGQIENAEVEVLDLNDFEMPIYSIDLETVSGIPEKARLFKDKIRQADGLIISFAEHNGTFSTAFKNIWDWISRIEKNTWLSKPTFLMATSPGPRGAVSVLNTAITIFPYRGANVVSNFSLPSFHENFKEDIIDPTLKTEFQAQLANFKEQVEAVNTAAV